MLSIVTTTINEDEEVFSIEHLIGDTDEASIVVSYGSRQPFTLVRQTCEYTI